MYNLKPCPFCGGYIRIMEYCESIVSETTKAYCMGCGMYFRYDRYFEHLRSKGSNLKVRVPVNESFETVFNRRMDGDSQ